MQRDSSTIQDIPDELDSFEVDASSLTACRSGPVQGPSDKASRQTNSEDRQHADGLCVEDTGRR